MGRAVLPPTRDISVGHASAMLVWCAHDAYVEESLASEETELSLQHAGVAAALTCPRLILPSS